MAKEEIQNFNGFDMEGMSVFLKTLGISGHATNYVDGLKKATEQMLYAVNKEYPIDKPEQYLNLLYESSNIAVGKYVTTNYLLLPVVTLTEFGSVGTYVEVHPVFEKSMLVHSFIDSEDTIEGVCVSFEFRQIFSKEVIEIIKAKKRKK